METPATLRIVLLKGDAVGRKYNSLGLSISSVPICAILLFEFPLRDVHPSSASLFLALRAALIVRNTEASYEGTFSDSFSFIDGVRLTYIRS
jgi:hypothetical protein